MCAETRRAYFRTGGPGGLALMAGMVLGATALAVPLRAQAPTPADFPFLIYCEYEGIDHA